VKFGIVTFPGSNCDHDAFHAVVDELGEQAVYLWHKNHDLENADVIVLPGGFSYGDYLRAGAIARFSPIMNEVIAHAARGAPVLAVCNGFQIACEAGLLPGALLRNAGLQFRCDWVRLRVENAETMFTERYHQGQILRIPIAHGGGQVYGPGEAERAG
jgi:phosphoribosylformylglycinamidine synthase subunit PurQ / glutaminase